MPRGWRFKWVAALSWTQGSRYYPPSCLASLLDTWRACIGVRINDDSTAPAAMPARKPNAGRSCVSIAGAGGRAGGRAGNGDADDEEDEEKGDKADKEEAAVLAAAWAAVFWSCCLWSSTLDDSSKVTKRTFFMDTRTRGADKEAWRRLWMMRGQVVQDEAGAPAQKDPLHRAARFRYCARLRPRCGARRRRSTA